MGLFDSLKRRREVALTPRAASLLACISMIAADGNIEESELDIIRRIDGNAQTADWDTALETWKRVRNASECVELATPHLNNDQRRFTMANLVDIAMADGSLAGAEKTLLEKYLDAFGLEDTFIEELVRIISIKNDNTVLNGVR